MHRLQRNFTNADFKGNGVISKKDFVDILRRRLDLKEAVIEDEQI